MSAIRIGPYQLRNLAGNQLKFIYLDLRSDSQRAAYSGDPGLVSGARAVSESAATDLARAEAASMDFPIVVLCQTGEASERAAQRLEEAGFINVFVVSGGAEGLEEGLS